MFHENVASERPSHQAMFKFSFDIHNTNKEKFTVDTKMSCLHPSSFKVAYSGKDAKSATFPSSSFLHRQHTSFVHQKEKALTQGGGP